jgi:acetyl esterase/lipase
VGEWFTNGHDPHDPLISPLYADVQGLAPLYIQARTGDILIGQIRDFVDQAKQQGAMVLCDEWDDMPHDFQAYGDAAPQAADALARLARQIRSHTMTAVAETPPTAVPTHVAH